MTRRGKSAATRGLWLRGNVWWLAETLPGVGRVRISLGVSDLGDALREAAVIRAEPWRVATAATGGDLVAAWEASMEARGVSRSWREHGVYVVRAALVAMGGVPPEAVGRPMVEGWLADVRARLSDGSAGKYFQRVAEFFAWLVERGVIRVSPAAGLVAPRPVAEVRRVFLSAQDARRLLDLCEDEALKFCLFCALHAGLRKGEVVAARPGWFDLQAGLLHVQNGPGFTIKDRENRTIPLTDEFREFLATYGMRKPFMLAPDVEAGRSRYRWDFRKRWKSHLARCELSGITFHDLRRTFASLLVSSGVSVYKVAKWLGDGVEVVEKRYGHLVANDAEINAAWR